MSSRRRARKPEFAIFSGYEMSREGFMDMVSQMPVLRSRLGESYDLGKCVCVYDGLCEKSRVPNVMALYETDARRGEEKYAAVSSFFFPTRYIDYTGKSQLQDADNAPFAQETEKDRARLAHIARCIQDDGGGSPLDTTRFTFRWVKDYHPCFSVVSLTMFNRLVLGPDKATPIGPDLIHARTSSDQAVRQRWSRRRKKIQVEATGAESVVNDAIIAGERPTRRQDKSIRSWNGKASIPSRPSRHSGCRVLWTCRRERTEHSYAWNIGDEVMGLAVWGAYAEYIAVEQTQLMRKPAHLDWVEAARFLEVFLTGPELCLQVGYIRSGCVWRAEGGRSVLIHAAATGVGWLLSKWHASVEREHSSIRQSPTHSI
ncbi:hypothetical protein BDZ89DRAFT_1046997 [Hymenopellis radicata]|nr:hypothetical protein BDZ89DRAFT_1046997 [Hymenopellis radicata]